MRRVLLVGWDGACWPAIDPLLADGRLPHLASLLQSGWRTTLRSTVPAVTPAAWTAMATALDPGATGVLGFRHLDLRRRSGYCPDLASSADLRGRTLFELASQQGVGVAALAFPMTWPPFPLRDGVLLAGWPRPETAAAPVLPESMAEALGPWARRTGPADPEVTDDGRRDPLAAARERDARTHRAALHVLATRADQLVAVVYQGTDHVAHRAWGLPALDAYLEQVDTWLGELREAAGPDCDVLLVSDHGFGPAPDRTVHLGRALEQEGLLTVEPDGSGGSAIAAARAGVSTGLRKRVRDHLPGTVRRWAWERGAGIDRIRRADVMRVPLYGPWEGLVVQVEGRQSGGAVPAADWATCRERAIACMRGLEDERGPLAVHVWRREELWRGPRLAELPDVVVELRDDCEGGAGLGPGPLVAPRERAAGEGSHRRDGIAAGAGPSFIAGEPATPLLPIDVLPTALAPLGLAVPEHVHGRARADLLRWAPPRPTLSAVTATAATERGGRADIERSLRALGYSS